MRPQSCKAKGRRLQQQIVRDLYTAFPTLGDGDLRSTGMGQPGEDVQMSAAARRLIPFSFEAKNVERVNVWQAFEQCQANCGAHAPCVVLKRNRADALCVLEWSTFVELLRANTATPCSPLQSPSPDTTPCVTHSPDPMSIPEQLRAIAARLEGD